jgi:heterodisulfide reductase subunit C
MARASVGAVDVSTDAGLWKCARCMACSERCPSDADPGEVIASLRELAVLRGNRPQYFVDEAKRFLQTGICFPRTGMTKKIRKELSLPERDTSPSALKDIEEISRRTALGRVKLE